jgi:hypothetical protein
MKEVTNEEALDWLRYQLDKEEKRLRAKYKLDNIIVRLMPEINKLLAKNYAKLIIEEFGELSPLEYSLKFED